MGRDQPYARRMSDHTYRILVTNDDGVASAGLANLANHLAADGHDVIVAAPAEEASGSGAAIGGIMPGDEVQSTSVVLPDAPDLTAFAVIGAPGRCVLAAAIGAFGPPPDLVISGINPGANVGKFLQLHSGTLGAALTAAGMGIRGLAVSIDGSEPTHWDTAGIVAARLVDYLASCERRTTLNLNLPDVPLSEVKGLRSAPVGSSAGGRRQLTLTGSAPGVQSMNFETVPAHPNRPAPTGDTDSSLVEDGYATLVRVVPPTDVPLGDVPAVFV